MNCINCGSSSTGIFYNEIIPCGHCNEDNEIVHYSCRDCGVIWKAIGNKHVLMGDPDEEQLLNDLVKSFMTFIVEPKSTMQEVIHKCLRCGTISYEIQPQLYHCPDCSFEWEVI